MDSCDSCVCAAAVSCEWDTVLTCLRRVAGVCSDPQHTSTLAFSSLLFFVLFCGGDCRALGLETRVSNVNEFVFRQCVYVTEPQNSLPFQWDRCSGCLLGRVPVVDRVAAAELHLSGISRV